MNRFRPMNINVQKCLIFSSILGILIAILYGLTLFMKAHYYITISTAWMILLLAVFLALNALMGICCCRTEALQEYIISQSIMQNFKLLEIMHSIPVGILITNKDYQVIYCNEVYRNYRQDKEIWIGQKYEQHINIQESMKTVTGSLISEYKDTISTGQNILYQNYITRDKSLVSIAIDITHSQQMMKLTRLKTLELITGHIAHTFSNLLTTVSSYGELLQENLSASHTPHASVKYIQEILRANQQGKQLIQYLLQSNKSEAQKAITIPVKEVWHHMLGLIQASPNRNIKVKVLASDFADMYMRVYHALLNDLLLNVFLNAQDVLIDNPAGKITIEIKPESRTEIQNLLKQNKKTSKTTKDQTAAVTYGDLSTDETQKYVMLRVTDNGPGIPPDNINKIFEPFFTTSTLNKKPGYRYGGSGLGLSTIHSTLDKHDGIMHLSTSDKGTCFSFYFPTLHFAKSVDKDIANLSMLSKGAKPQILIVEDDHAVAQVMTTVIQKAGYDTFRVNDGQEAQKILKAKNIKWKLMIIDHIMPGETGLKVIEKLRQDGFTFPVILCTGFLQEISENDLRRKDLNIHVLAKPYHNQDLINMIHTALNSKHDQREKDEQDKKLS